MPRNSLFASRLLVVLLACLALSGCNKVDPNSPLGQRQIIFKQMLKTSEQLGGMLRGRVKFDAPTFAASASLLASLAQQPWQHFPQARDAGKSSAKDEVWENQQRFDELAKQLETTTAALALIGSQPPLLPANLAKPFKQVENACEACHQEFRDY
jgi:cytochrome c556